MNVRTPDFCSARARTALAWSLFIATLLCFAGPAWAAGQAEVQAAETWSVSDLRTSFAFRHDLLQGIGLTVEDVEETGEALDHHATSVSMGKDVVFAGVISPSLDLRVIGHVPQRFDGVVLHQGGFRLVSDAGTIRMAPFSVRSGPKPRTLEVLSADGQVVFFADNMHFSLERELGRLRSFNLDLRVAPALAAKLDAPALESVWVGTLALEARFPSRDENPFPGGCEPDWSGDVDVQLTEINNVDQVLNNSGMIGMAPSAELKNVGTADVPWWRKFTGPFPPYDNDQHPYLVWALYRIENDRIEQLGVSDIKHAFLTLNFNCTPTSEGCDSHVLGLGCEDIYGSGTNDSRSHLSYRDEILAGPALWESTGSHFDPDGDGVQEHPPQFPDGTFDHRLIVAESELENNADYFMQAFYIIRDDINIFNSMAYREINPTDNGNFWSFPTIGGTITGSVLDRWVDPSSPGAGNANEVVVDGSGHIQLAAKSTVLPDGRIRFEYALLNHDYDPQINSFSVPLNGEAAIDIGFRDIDNDAGNDWLTSIEDGRLVWRLPAGATTPDVHTGGAALDWGLMYNFSFTVFGGDVQNSQGQMGRHEGPGAIRIDTIAPSGGSSLIFYDGFESGDTNMWTITSP
ncbi:MAG: hypothetical protein AAGM22_23185 [Acidobacteriota bacterium]